MTALTLLISALQLLTFVSANSVPQSLKDQAISLANTAIQVANAEIARAQNPIIQPVAPVDYGIITPTVGSNTQSAPVIPTVIHMDKSEIIIVQTNTPKPDPANGLPYGAYSFRVSALNSEGVYTKNPVTMTKPDGSTVTVTPNGVSTKDSNDWAASFSYEPQTQGTHTITFSSGNLSKQFIINVN